MEKIRYLKIQGNTNKKEVEKLLTNLADLSGTEFKISQLVIDVVLFLVTFDGLRQFLDVLKKTCAEVHDFHFARFLSLLSKKDFVQISKRVSLAKT